MAKAISAPARQELVLAVGERYRGGTRAEKVRILDEFVAVTGFHRKHALRVLNGASHSVVGPQRGTRARVYGDAVREALIQLWEASDRICGKRLRSLLPVLVASLERHGHLRLDDAVRGQVLAVSAATIDRILAGPRARACPRPRRRPALPAVRRAIPVRTFADWKDPQPGYMEVDLVAHCGDSVSGSYVHSLVLTDVSSTWTECVALAVRESSLVVDGLKRLAAEMPFPLRGIDTDNGSEFMNELLLVFCRERGIEFTRSRPYRKNDQAWIEQKNGSVVRRLVGYGRLDGIAAADALARLYSASRLFVNFFQPSFKLAEKHRDGAHVRKRYHAPETPASRLLRAPEIGDPVKERIRAVLATTDPLQLLDEIRTVQQHLAVLAAGGTPPLLQHRHADLDRFLRTLASAWRDGEVRPTHRADPRPSRDWRTRADPFEAVWPSVLVWLESEPDQTAKELFARLRLEHPNAFQPGQLRTLQRRVKEWRRAAARRLVFIGQPLDAASSNGGPSAVQAHSGYDLGEATG